MGAIGGLLGTAGGSGGTGFAGPEYASIASPVTEKQANTAYDQNQAALQQQQAFLTALQGQNGIQNQSNVFNQLQNVAAGRGPNPAQAMLAQATGANVANQAALMAGQRGAGSNVGLIARQAANQGAQTQQQAANQAAVLQANQSLGALQQLGGIAGQQVGQQAAATSGYTTAQQNEQQQLLNSIAAANNARVGMQSNINSANAGLANTTLQGSQAMIGGFMNGVGSLMGGMGGGGSSGGGGSAAGGVTALAAAAEGGRVPYSNGSYVQTPDLTNDEWNALSANPNAAPASAVPLSSAAPVNQSQPKKQGPSSSFGQFLVNMNYGNPGANSLSKGISQGIGSLANLFTSGKQDKPNNPYEGSGFTPEQMDVERQRQYASDIGAIPSLQAEGGEVPALVSPGEQYLPPKDLKEVIKGGKNPLEVGERIPGKPKHPGNDYRNDTVKKTLKSGGIVIPNSVMQSKNPSKEAAKFVAAVMAKKGK